MTSLIIHRLLPARASRLLRFQLDLIKSMFCLFAGPILPTLPPPTTGSAPRLPARPTATSSSSSTSSTTTVGVASPHLKTAIVTGANSGIGLQIATDLARSGRYRVFLACRSLERAAVAIQTINYRVPDSRGRVFALKLDTGSFESVNEFAKAWSERVDVGEEGGGTKMSTTIDVLFHNAGMAALPLDATSDLNDDGVEMLYATNFLGGFALTYFLEPCLASDARVILTTSTGQYASKFSDDFSIGPVRGVVEPGFHLSKMKGIGGFDIVATGGTAIVPPTTAAGHDDNGAASRNEALKSEVGKNISARYSNTKSMQCAFARLLQRKWDREFAASGDQTGSTETKRKIAHTFTPGFTSTPIFGKFQVPVGLWTKEPIFAVLKATENILATDVEQGATTGSWLAMTEDEKVVDAKNGGGYWDRMTRRLSNADMAGDELLERLWTRWENDAGVTWR